MWCHLPLLAPAAGLAVFLVLPLPLASGTYLVILVVSGLIWRKTAEAMSRPVATGAEAIVGKRGEVVSWSGPRGKVRCCHELYRARSDEGRLAPGDEVEVVGVDGITLQVACRQPEASSPT